MECPYCHTIFEKKRNFCSNCGKKLSGASEEKSQQKRTLHLIITFYIVTILLLAVNLGVQLYQSTGLLFEIGIHLIDIMVVITFVFFDLIPIIRLYRLPKVNWKIVVFSIIFPLFSAITVHYGLEFVSDALNIPHSNYIFEYHFYNNPVFWAVLFVAILPPIFEELAFRGFLHNQLIKVTSPSIAIIGTAFLFALVHFSILSIIWIFPFGLILGYIRHKYRTLWYGMIIHFMHNFVVLAIDYYYFYAPTT
ncbi:lysostaphin resistance A-like protein [Flavobacteriaceae bacterium M23B6Z8]